MALLSGRLQCIDNILVGHWDDGIPYCVKMGQVCLWYFNKEVASYYSRFSAKSSRWECFIAISIVHAIYLDRKDYGTTTLVETESIIGIYRCVRRTCGHSIGGFAVSPSFYWHEKTSMTAAISLGLCASVITLHAKMAFPSVNMAF